MDIPVKKIISWKGNRTLKDGITLMANANLKAYAKPAELNEKLTEPQVVWFKKVNF